MPARGSQVLLTLLVLFIPQLPVAARARTFLVLPALRTNWLTQNADVIGALRFVAGSLTNLRFGFGHQTAMEQLAAAERLATPAPTAQPAPQASGATARMTYAGFMDMRTDRHCSASRCRTLPAPIKRLLLRYC